MRKHFFIFYIQPILASAICYDVHFIGLSDRQALEAVLETSQLVSLQHRPPSSINGLYYRIAADIPELLKILHAFAYYDATITSQISNIENRADVDILIDPGKQFSLKSYQVFRPGCTEPAEIYGCCPLTSETIGLKLNTAALSSKIINAELNILNELACCGYPLASVEDRTVEVDMKDQTVEASSCIETGPFATFGSTSYQGIQNTKMRFIKNKVLWHEGCPYNASLIKETQDRLLSTDLFSSVYISHDETLQEDGSLPINVRIAEALNRKISIGAFYATVNGPGGNINWIQRNLRGMGESLHLQAEYAVKSYTGSLTYQVPDFFHLDQTFQALAQIYRAKINPYHSLRYRFAMRLDRKLPPYSKMTIGTRFDHIHVTNSANNGTFFLVGLPLFGKYDRSNDPLNPTKGYILVYSVTPYQSMQEANIRFAKQRLTLSCYIPLLPKDYLTLALRTQFGSIAGARRGEIPLTKLFLGGSEDELRGYKYQTVSPLRGTKPLGGRSALYATAELRFLFFEKIGIVPFADFGTVTNSEIPTIDTKWFKSLGIGLRYFSFFGPLRFDIGFPLNKRKHVDSNYQVYASVGQSF